MIGFTAVIAEFDCDDKKFLIDLYSNYYRLVRKTIYNITYENQDIEDLINDSFIKLIGKLSVIRALDVYKMTSYIVCTARSVAINYIKHQKVEKKYIYFSDETDIDEKLVDYEDIPEIRLIRQEEMSLLNGAIFNLPDKERDILHFKYILDLKDSEIATIFGISAASVRQYLTRARRDAKKIMEKGMSTNGQQ